MGTFRIRICLVLLGAALLAPARALAQVNYASSIVGVARDASGGVLPGVTVEASSPALIEKTRTVVTDGQGRYTFVDLVAGTYTITFTLSGFTTFRREELVLPTNFTATVNADMKVGVLSETVTVTGTSPVVDVLRVEHRNTITSEALEALPTNKTLPAFVALTPGVIAAATAQDVGGTKGEVFIQPRAYGGHAGESRTVLDGFTTNSPDVSGSGRVFVPNPASTQAVAVELGDGPGDAASSGVMINFIPRDGGNTFTGTVISNYANGGLQGTNLTPELEARGITARSIAGLDKLWDMSIGLGGPVMRDRLWFFTSHRYWGSVNRVLGQFYNNEPQSSFFYVASTKQAIDDFTNRHNNIRLTWQVSRGNKLNVSWDNQYRCDCHRSVSSTLAPEAAGKRVYRPDILTATWSFTATSRLLFEAGSSTNRLDYSPKQQSISAPDGISVTDQGTGLVYRAVPSSTSESTGVGQKYSLTQNTRVSASYVTGSHAFKAGMTMQQLTRTYHNEGAGINYRIRDGKPNQVTLFAYPLLFHEVLKADIGIYAQDQWTFRRLTINLAVRHDYFNAYVPAQTHPAGKYLPERQFGEVPCVPCWNNLSGRFSAAYDLFGNGKTAIKMSAGKYMGQELLTLATANNPISVSNPSANRAWVTDNGDFIPQEEELGPLSNPNFGTPVVTTRYDDKVLRHNRPYNRKYSAGIQHELLPRMAVGFMYYRTSWFNSRVTKNRAVSSNEYDPYSVIAPLDSRLPGGGGYVIDGLYNINGTAFSRPQDNWVTLASDFGKDEEVYDGYDVSINARLARGTFIGGGLNSGRTRTSSCYVVNSPQLRFCDSRPPFETQIKLNGAMNLPWRLTAAAVLQSLPGIPYNANQPFSNADVFPTLKRNLSGSATNVTINLIEPSSQYEARRNQLDLRFGRTFTVPGNGRVQASLDIYNIFNAAAFLAVNSSFGTAWRNPVTILDARLFKFGMQYDF
jgi:hypothetical protein